MNDPNDPFPDLPVSPGAPDSPPLNGGRHGRPAARRGAAKSDAVPRMENVRVTAPDLARRAALEKTRSRLVIAAGGFTVLFMAVLAKLTLATIIIPMAPHRPERLVADIVKAAPRLPVDATLPGQRAMITDRNGQPMAISLNTVSLFADPRQIGDAAEAARKLKQVLPGLDLAETTDRLQRDKKFT
jgi:cell division protein FtsI (penicillin-binding protein 3)